MCITHCKKIWGMSKFGPHTIAWSKQPLLLSGAQKIFLSGGAEITRHAGNVGTTQNFLFIPTLHLVLKAIF